MAKYKVKEVETEVWYRPADIKFTREQMITFLLPNLDLLRMGHWPTKHNGYIDDRDYRSRNKSGGNQYETAWDIAAEIDARLDLIGSHKWIVLRLAVDFDEPLQVARDFKMTEDEMRIEYNNMLGFISGYKRKLCTYKVWRLITKVVHLLKTE